MNTIQLGPLAFPVAPLLLLVVWFAAQGLAGRLALKPWREAAQSALWWGPLVGLLVSRVVHVAINGQAYAANPFSMLDVRDGGWFAPAGVAAALAWMAWRVWRTRALARAVGISAALGLCVWWGATTWLAPATGRPLPNVKVLALDSGRPTTPAQLAAGRPMVINLWATWCAPCRAEMPAFAQAQADNPDVLFLFANQGESAAVAARYLATLGIAPSTAVLDPDWALGQAVGSRSLPTTLLVNAQGLIVNTHVGVFNRAALQVQVDAVRSKR